MIFATSHSYFTIWEVKKEERSCTITMSTSRKDKRSGNYLNSNWSYVQFVGDAYPKACKLNKRDRITNLEFGLSWEPYTNKDGDKVFAKSPRFVVFDFEIANNRDSEYKPRSKPIVADDEPDDDFYESSDDELPF